MLLILGTISLPPEKLDQAREAMSAMVAASRAEPGCMAYSYAVDILDPGLIRVTEIWADQAALDRHFAAPHIAEWRASWPFLGIHDRRLQLYEAGASRPT